MVLQKRAAPIATSEFVICYALSKLTKRSDKFICFPTSHSLRTIFCLSFDLPQLFTIFVKQSRILCSIYASSCDVQKERYALIDQSDA